VTSPETGSDVTPPPPAGGSGALARMAARLYPGSEVTVFETPDVVAAARAHFPPPADEDGAEPRVCFLSGGRGAGVWAGLSEGRGLASDIIPGLQSHSPGHNFKSIQIYANLCKFIQTHIGVHFAKCKSSHANLCK
jgi:hypothetical protein